MDLETRLQRLERQNRRLKQFGAIGVALVVVGVGLGAQASKSPITIQATHFVVRDTDGNLRAWLGMRTDGPGLTIYDKTQKARISMSMLGDDSQVSMFDGNGQHQVEISASAQSKGLTLYDRTRARAQVVLGSDSSITLWDSSGGTTATLPAASTAPIIPATKAASEAEASKADVKSK